VSSAATRSESYVQALQTANTFLHAWLDRDAKDGLSLMSTVLLKPPADSTAAEHTAWLQLYMSGLSNPHHQAFEIHEGKVVDRDHFSFPVTLYELATGQPTANAYSNFIELVHESGGWRVLILPQSSDNQ
jgi:hypothetical protein